MTGLIQFSIGTSNSVEAAVNFLYGQRPKIAADNVESILEVVEFLMMDELKALCIKKLKSLQVDINNCLKLVLLTSRYDFYLEKLSNFILSHLQELLPYDEMLLLDRDSVYYILTDPLLSYVSREDSLKYLIRWTAHFAERNADFAELWACLETEDISPSVLTTVSLDCLSESNRLLCSSLSTISDIQRNVIIAYPPQYNNGKYFLYVFCTDNKVWYQLLVGPNSRDWPTRPGVILVDQHIVVNMISYRERITYHNLHTRNTVEKSISVDGDACEEITTFDQIFATDDKILCIKNKECYTEHETTGTEKGQIGIDLIDLIRVQALCGGNEQLAYSLIAAGHRQRKRRKHDTCTLFMSESDNEEDAVVLKPLMSVNGTVESLCVQQGIVCLLIPERKEIVAFAYEQQCVKTLDLSNYILDDKSYMCPCSYGGVYAITNSHVLQIDIRLNDSNIAANVTEFLIPKQENVDDFWRIKYPIKLEVLQDKVMIIEKTRANYENKISYRNLPETVSFLYKKEKVEIHVPDKMRRDNIHFLQARLPKEKLRCPIGCPHCKYTATREIQYPAYERDSDSDEYTYFDDSDVYYGYYDSSD